MPFISVIVPVYNVEKYLRRCVISLLTQNYEDCEILLVNDGSTDSSGALCDELAAEYSKVQAVHKENGGLASARNYGFQFAHGEYVTFVDSDDYVLQDYFSYLDAHLKESGCDILKFGYKAQRNGSLGSDTVPVFEERIYDRAAIETDILPGTLGPYRLFDYSKNIIPSAWASAYRTEFLKDHQILFRSEREILSEDYLFNYAALLSAQQIEVCHKALYVYDYREGSLSKRYRADMINRMLKLQSAYKAELLKCDLYERYRAHYYANCVDGFYACITNECCGWNSADAKQSVKAVRKILHLPQCREALRKCYHKDMTFKGRAIYYLMRWRWAKLMCFLYKKATKS